MVLPGLAAEVVDDHVVVQHLGLVHAAHGIQLVLPSGLGIGSPLVKESTSFLAQNKRNSGQDNDQNRDQDSCDQARMGVAVVNVIGRSQGEHGAVRQDVAGFARIAREAAALVVVELVHAETIMHAGTGRALVDLDGAILAGESRTTGADKVIDRVMTSASVGTRIDGALVHVLLAVGPDEPGEAVALVVGHKVDAGAAILARVDLTVINVLLAMLAGKSGRTMALVFVRAGHMTSAAILAGCLHPTSVHLDLAVDTGEALGALALVTGSGMILAMGAIFAGSVLASLGVQFTMGTVEPKRADARIIVDTGALTSASIDTEVVAALVGDPDLAVLAGPSWRA